MVGADLSRERVRMEVRESALYRFCGLGLGGGRDAGGSCREGESEEGILPDLRLVVDRMDRCADHLSAHLQAAHALGGRVQGRTGCADELLARGPYGIFAGVALYPADPHPGHCVWRASSKEEVKAPEDGFPAGDAVSSRHRGVCRCLRDRHGRGEGGRCELL